MVAFRGMVACGPVSAAGVSDALLDGVGERIWSVGEKRFISARKLAGEVLRADYLLIGEVHDNPYHHKVQAWLIAGLSRVRKPAVVFEMITEDQRGDLQRYLAKPGAGADGLGAALAWSKRGWPTWKIYRPIAEVALAAGLQINVGDASRKLVRSVGRKGLGSLGLEARVRLGLDRPLDAGLRAALATQLVEGHCNLLPKAAIGPMIGVQRFRDAAMAGSLLEAAKRVGVEGAVLIAGNGHARSDRGVGWYLRRRAPGARITTVLLIEAQPGERDSARLLADAPNSPDGGPAGDYVWFTPPWPREDPCEGLRKLMEKRKKTGKNSSQP